MAILDKQGLQHYANKMCNADNRKVGSKSLPTALNDIDTAIDGFKTLFESEYGTPVNMEIENNQNIFTIGTGININKKDDVENSFTDLKISGNTLVNLCPLQPNLIITRIKSEVFYPPMKANTTYTLITKISNSNYDAAFGAIICVNYPSLDTSFIAIGDSASESIINGYRIQKITTKSENVKSFAFAVHSNNTYIEENKFTLDYAIILEGDWTNKTLPQYFDGLKSIGEKEDTNHKISISSIGKNLLNIKDFKSVNTSSRNISVEYKENKIILTSNNTNNYTYTSVELNLEQVRGKSLKVYHNGVQVTNNTNQRIIQFNILKEDGSYSYLGSTNNNTTVTIPVDSKKVSLCLYTNNSNTNNFSNTVEINELMICYADASQIPYESHKEDKKEILLNEPLRGLPNGVKDTIEKINGEWKIVRRCVEVTLNGSETSWNRNTDLNGTEVLFFYINTKHSTSLPEGATKSNGNTVHIQCDSFPCYALKDRVNNKNNNIEAIIYSDSTNPLIQFHINKSKLTSEDVTGFKQWLSEDISPVTLQCWKNGTISIDEVIPAETTHTVALNKSAQIQKNIEELTILRNRVKALEEQYDKTALNQAYEVELLRLDMQLDNII